MYLDLTQCGLQFDLAHEPFMPKDKTYGDDDKMGMQRDENSVYTQLKATLTGLLYAEMGGEGGKCDVLLARWFREEILDFVLDLYFDGVRHISLHIADAEPLTVTLGENFPAWRDETE